MTNNADELVRGPGPEHFHEMTLTRSVLQLVPIGADNVITYKSEDDVEERRPVVRLSHEQWKELGSPLHITIAVWPGDRQDLMESEDFPQ